jgi:hypothetical protein
MDLWPWDIELAADTTSTFDLGGKSLRVERVNPTTLRYRVGDDEKHTRLVGMTETASKLRFVPTLGPLPLLVFPNIQLLCPANSAVRCVLRLPLHIQVGIDDKTGFRRVDEIVPPSVSKALYGPVDSGVLCTSIHAPNAASVEDIEQETSRDAENRPPLLRSDALDVQNTEKAERQLVAYTHLRVRNKTEEPLLVSKVMIPAGVISLYQAGQLTHTNEVSMRLLSAQEAELEFLKCPVSETTPLPDLGGHRTDSTPKKPYFFSHTYRSKTGLEFGF